MHQMSPAPAADTPAGAYQPSRGSSWVPDLCPFSTSSPNSYSKDFVNASRTRVKPAESQRLGKAVPITIHGDQIVAHLAGLFLPGSGMSIREVEVSVLTNVSSAVQLPSTVGSAFSVCADVEASRVGAGDATCLVTRDLFGSAASCRLRPRGSSFSSRSSHVRPPIPA